MDAAEREMEKILARQRAQKAASKTGTGYVKQAVSAIRKGKSARQRELDKIKY